MSDELIQAIMENAARTQEANARYGEKLKLYRAAEASGDLQAMKRVSRERDEAASDFLDAQEAHVVLTRKLAASKNKGQ